MKLLADIAQIASVLGWLGLIIMAIVNENGNYRLAFILAGVLIILLTLFSFIGDKHARKTKRSDDQP